MPDNIVDSITWEYSGLSEIQGVAARLIDYAFDYKIWLFAGELGAGKTTLIKEICRELGVSDVVSSPTFSLINEYEGVLEDKFYHFDFYRVKDEHEAYDIGVEEYLYSGNYCFIEWPSKIPNLIPEKYLMIKIVTLDDDRRQLVITKHEAA